MKIFLPVVCSLLLVGCNDTAQTSSSSTENTVQTSSTSTKPESLPAPVAKKNTSATEPAPTVTAIAAIDGGVLFGQKCAACHGSKAEKSALNKSLVIANLSEQQIQDALHGYQAGTYGKEMKAMMQGQARPLSNGQIDALAKYISNL